MDKLLPSYEEDLFYTTQIYGYRAVVLALAEIALDNKDTVSHSLLIKAAEIAPDVKPT